MPPQQKDPYAATAEQDPYAATAEGQAPAATSVKATPAAPEGTFTKVARGAVMGAAEGAGIKPALSPKEVIYGTFKQLGTGVKDLLTEVWEANRNVPGGPMFGEGPRAAAAALDIIPTFLDNTARSLENGQKDFMKAVQEKDWEKASETAASMATTIALLRSSRRAGAAKDFDTMGTVRKATKAGIESKIRPREVPLAGEKVPVLVGESEPSSFAGRTQNTLKRAGAGAQRFKQFADAQEAHVKAVIRNVAKETSGEIGPMPEEPGPAMSRAADATFDKARPMYNALDHSLISVPDSLDRVSKVTETAISRARKLGVEVSTEGESVDLYGRKITPQTDPNAWKLLKEQGLVPGGGQPLSTYMKVRSELLKMQRSSSDAALRNAIGNELKSMNANMEKALEGTPLLDDWHEASRLWSKGYAIRDVADALHAKTKGTPTTSQASGLGKIATTIEAAPLVSALNDLSRDGILDKAFSQPQIKNLRAAIDILDRSTGKPGEEFKVGYGIHSTIWRNIITSPAYPLVVAMTKTEGVEALRESFSAKHSTAIKGLDRFMRLAGTGGIVQGTLPTRKPADQLRDLRKIQENHSSNPALPVGEEN